MNVRTALLILLVAAFFSLLYFFIQDSHNQHILLSSLRLGHLEFTVARALAGFGLLSALLTAGYFSLRALGGMRVIKADGGDKKQARLLDQAETLIVHGQAAKALSILEGTSGRRSQILLGRAYLDLDRADAAIEPLSLAYDQGNYPPAGYLLADARKAMGQGEIVFLKEMLERAPKDGERIARRLLRRYVANKAWPEAVALLEHFNNNNWHLGETEEAGYRYAHISSDEGLAPKRRIEAYQQLLKRFPQFRPATVALGEAFAAAGQDEKALTLFEKAYEQSKDPVFLECLEGFYMDRERPEDAIAVYRKLLIREESLQTQFMLGRLYFNLEMHDDAASFLEPLETMINELPGLRYYLAELRRRSGRLEEALSDYRQLTEDKKMTASDFRCGHCQAEQQYWQPQCPCCERWDSLKIQIQDVRAVAINTRPIYS